MNITQEIKVTLKENADNITSDSVLSKHEQAKVKINDIVCEAKVSNTETERPNDSGETNTKICGEQMSARTIKIADESVLENSSNICSLADNSNKTNEIVEDKKNTESITLINEKTVESSAQDSKVILKESTENVTFEAATPKYEESDVANKNILFEKRENSQLLNVSTRIEEEIDNSCNDENIQDKEMNYADTDEINKTFENIHQASVPISDAEESHCYEKDVKIDEKLTFADSMEGNDNSSSICLSADNPDKIDEVAENIKNTDFTAAIKYNEKIIQDDMLDTKVKMEQITETQANVSTSLTDEQIRACYAKEVLFNKNNENQKKDCDEFLKENDKVVSEKNVEHSVSAESSNYERKTEDAGSLQVSEKVENQTMGDSCMDTKALNEDIKNFITLLDVDKATEKNENVLQNIDMELMPIIDCIDFDNNDSNITDASYMKNENSEIPNLKCEEEISGQNLKVKNDEHMKTFNDYSFSNLPDVMCMETDDKKILQTDENDFKADKELVEENAQGSGPNELSILSNIDDDDTNQIFAEEEKSDSTNSSISNAEGSKVSVSDDKVKQDLNKSDVLQDTHLNLQENNQDSEAIEEKMEVSLESEKEKEVGSHAEGLSVKFFTDLCNQMENPEGCEATTSEEKDVIQSEDISQDAAQMHTNKEDSSILEDGIKTSLESGSQDTETEEESKMEVSLESDDNSSHVSEDPASSSSSLSSKTRSGRLIRRPERLGLK